MWNIVLDKLARLKALDRQCLGFGAESHRYLLRPCLSELAIREIERRIGVAFPDQLRSFYRDVGDGIAGPHYGLKPAANLKNYRASERYPGIEALQRKAEEEGWPREEEEGFSIPREEVTGLLLIIEMGCGHEVCLVATGAKPGKVVYLSSEDTVREAEDSLIDLYNQWLDEEIERFQAVEALMRAGWSYRDIQEKMIARFGTYDAGDRIASIANVARPPALFGQGNVRTYHGATQFPWYEQVLREWQKANR